jgi:hypothetical protein
MGKVTGAVERVEEQCVPLNELNFSQVRFWSVLKILDNQWNSSSNCCQKSEDFGKVLFLTVNWY